MAKTVQISWRTQICPKTDLRIEVGWLVILHHENGKQSIKVRNRFAAKAVLRKYRTKGYRVLGYLGEGLGAVKKCWDSPGKRAGFITVHKQDGVVHTNKQVHEDHYDDYIAGLGMKGYEYIWYPTNEMEALAA